MKHFLSHSVKSVGQWWLITTRDGLYNHEVNLVTKKPFFGGAYFLTEQFPWNWISCCLSIYSGSSSSYLITVIILELVYLWSVIQLLCHVNMSLGLWSSSDMERYLKPRSITSTSLHMQVHSWVSEISVRQSDWRINTSQLLDSCHKSWKI